ncbi:MAG: hypothetical protein JO101_06815 [Candidatus Eremiobacteraeota bacterium]|nr:hypothetical protein [Candidatus Eremiobacteraeota bacterium]MBV8355014.1 hypothetical protein [Candidatus Eremiobacteraeota bacterium]
MITLDVSPPEYSRRAFALSIALHAFGFCALVLLLPAYHSTLGGRGIFDTAPSCEGVCSRVFALTIEYRARPAPLRDRHERAPLLAATPHRRPLKMHARPVAVNVARASASRSLLRHVPVAANSAPFSSIEPAPVAASGDRGANANVAVVAPATDTPVASQVQPNTIAANPGTGVEMANDAQPRPLGIGPDPFGSHHERPVLRDRALLDQVLARIGRRGVVRIAVDDQGHALVVDINAPGLDPAAIDELRKRLLVARYLPPERDGITFDGTLEIRAPTQ